MNQLFALKIILSAFVLVASQAGAFSGQAPRVEDTGELECKFMYTYFDRARGMRPRPARIQTLKKIASRDDDYQLLAIVFNDVGPVKLFVSAKFSEPGDGPVKEIGDLYIQAVIEKDEFSFRSPILFHPHHAAPVIATYQFKDMTDIDGAFINEVTISCEAKLLKAK